MLLDLKKKRKKEKPMPYVGVKNLPCQHLFLKIRIIIKNLNNTQIDCSVIGMNKLISKVKYLQTSRDFQYAREPYKCPKCGKYGKRYENGNVKYVKWLTNALGERHQKIIYCEGK